MLGSYLVAAQLAASQEGFSSMSKSIWKKVFNSYLINGSDVKYLHTGHPD
jgi:hypothetical protein